MRELLKPQIKEHLLWYLDDRFGVDSSIFDNLEFTSEGRSIWLSTKETCTYSQIDSLESYGLRSFSFRNNLFKPTTHFLQLYSRSFEKNIFTLNSLQFEKYILGKDLALELETTKGLVVLCYEGLVLGSGLYKEGILESHFPKKLVEYFDLKDRDVAL